MAKENSKSVLMIVAHNNFRDEEYTAAREKLEKNGTKITVASTTTNGARSTQGMQINPDVLLDAVNADDYDAVVFVGGSGASQYWHDAKAHEIACHAASHGKVVAASSHAAVTLAVAGLLKDKTVTGHVAVYEKLTVQGANYSGKKLEIDGNIITSSGANAAREFAEALVNSLN
ncbi:MAG: DJ-1/PfpI family protein [bacterium]